jgi:hypothetical protein
VGAAAEAAAGGPHDQLAQVRSQMAALQTEIDENAGGGGPLLAALRRKMVVLRAQEGRLLA